jgi:hypothetical protein
MIFSRDLKRLTFETMIPFSKDELFLIINPRLAFRFSGIADDNNRYLDIKDIMEKEVTFATPDFNKRCREFAQVMDTRIERYFITKKSPYVFFDEEEQDFLRGIIKKNSLTATVTIYMREDTRGRFNKIAYTSLSAKDHIEVSRHLKRMRVMAVVKPDKYYSLHVSAKSRAESRYEKMNMAKESDFMEMIFSRYPRVAEIKDRNQFKIYYRGLSKKYHPDQGGSHEIFACISSDFEKLKETYWYKKLPKGEAETVQNEDTADSEDNILMLVARGGGQS